MSIVFKSFDFFLNKNHPNKISSNAKFQTEVLEVHRLFPHSLKTSKSISFVVSEQKYEQEAPWHCDKFCILKQQNISKGAFTF